MQVRRIAGRLLLNVLAAYLYAPVGMATSDAQGQASALRGCEADDKQDAFPTECCRELIVGLVSS